MYAKIADILLKNKNAETVSRRITDKTIKEIRDGFYITCKKRMTLRYPDKTTKEIEKGTHWLVLPPNETKDIDTKIRNNKTYFIKRTKTNVAPVFAEEQAFFDVKKEEINGKDIKEYFEKGVLTKKQLKKIKKTYRITINETGILKNKYQARKRNGELIIGGDTIEEVVKKAFDSGWRFIESVDENGNRITFDTKKEKETNEGIYDVITW